MGKVITAVVIGILVILFLVWLGWQPEGVAFWNLSLSAPKNRWPAIESKYILFEDDFSTPSNDYSPTVLSNGKSINDPEYISHTITMDAGQGYYQFRIDLPYIDTWITTQSVFTNTYIQTNVVKEFGPDINDIGIICRYKNYENFYLFDIDTTGQYAILKKENGDISVLGYDNFMGQASIEVFGWPLSNAIHTGNSINQISVVCVDAFLGLYVNNRRVFSIEDTTFYSGKVGLLVGTYEDGGLGVSFDDLVVKRAKILYWPSDQ